MIWFLAVFLAAAARADLEGLTGSTGLLSNFTTLLTSGGVATRFARQFRYFDNKTLFLSQATWAPSMPAGADAAYDSNFIASLDGGATFEPDLASLVWRAGFTKPQSPYSSYGGTVAAKFGNVLNKRQTVVFQEIKNQYFETQASVVNTVPCDLGVCDECVYQFGQFSSGCRGLPNVYPQNEINWLICTAALTRCLGFNAPQKRLLKCSVAVAPVATQACSFVQATEDYCRYMEVEFRRIGRTDFIELQRWVNQYLETWRNFCVFHVPQYYDVLEDASFFGTANPHRPNYDVAGGDSFGIRDQLTIGCAAFLGAPLTHLLAEPAYPCGGPPAATQLTCPKCPGGVTACTQQTCQFKAGVTAATFLQPKRIVYALDVTCRCAPAAPTLSITKAASGVAQFNFPTIFACKHTVSFKQADVQGGDASSYEPTGNCSGVVAFPSTFSLASEPAGTKKSFNLVATVDAPLERETLTLTSDIFVPFESVLTIDVLTEGMSAIVRRNVTVAVELSAAQTAAAPWQGRQPTLSTPTAFPVRVVTGLSVLAVTDSAGRATVRVLFPTLNAAQAHQHLQTITVKVTPAAVDQGQPLSYAGCASPCSKSFDLVHNIDVGTAALGQQRVLFTDVSVITLSGRVPFQGASNCFAADLKVEAFASATATMPLKSVTTTSDGKFSVIVPQNTPLELRFSRTKAPDYFFVNSDGTLLGAGAAKISVGGKSADATIDVPFRAATTPLTATTYGLPKARVAVVGGLCEFALSSVLGVASFKWRTPSCADNQLFSPSVTTTGGDSVALLIENVPPLRFVDLALALATNSPDATAATTLFATNYAAQVLDASLPAIEAPTSGASQVVSSGARLTAPLADSLLLLLPLDADAADLSAYGHASAPSRGAAPSFAAGAGLVVRSNGSALAFGHNSALDVGVAATAMFWLKVSAVSGSNATVLGLVNATGGDAVLINVESVGQTSFALAVRAGGVLLHSAPVRLNVRTHIAVVLGFDKPATIFVDGVASSGAARATTFTKRSAACAAAFQYDCVRELTIGAESNVAAARFDGNIDDVGLWSRALAANDVAFVVAAAADGRSLNTLVQAFPRYVYRAPVQLDLPLNKRRYFPPTDADESLQPRTVTDLLEGQTLESPRFAKNCSTNEGSRTAPLPLYKVQSGGAVALFVNVWEQYGAQRCFRVEGALKLRSTFTGACAPAAAQMSDPTVLPCEAAISGAAYGYLYFAGITTQAKLIPRDPTMTTSTVRRRLGDFSLTQNTPFLGEFRARFEGVRNAAEQTVWFHVTGLKSPEAASVFALPATDVPLLRLYKPPGDASQAFLSRNWARSVTLSFANSEGTNAKVTTDIDRKMGFGAASMTCTSVGVGVGFGAVAIATQSICMQNDLTAFLSLSYSHETTSSSRTAVTLSEAFSSSVLTEFHTALGNELLGKWGDVVVTTGITVLVTENYFNTLDLATCEIEQIYEPTWQPGDERVIDSLQVTPRGAVKKQQIDKWQDLIGALSADCGGQLAGPLKATYVDAELLARNLSSCTRLNTATGARVALTANETSEALKKFKQASGGVLRWTAILQNWEAMTCAALQAANTGDYYADDDTPACSTIGSSGAAVGKPAVWKLLADNQNQEFAAKLAAADKAVNEVGSRTGLRAGLCNAANEDTSPLGVSVGELKRAVGCQRPLAPLSPISAIDSVTKLSIIGPAGFTYASTATATRTESYVIGDESTWSNAGSIGGSIETKNAFLIKFESVNSIKVGGAGGGSSSMMTTGEQSITEATTVGFTIEDKTLGDSFGVSVFNDAVYGTPIFVTTGGASRCPHEPGTNTRERLRVTPESSKDKPIERTSTDPDAAILLDLGGLLGSLEVVDAQFPFYIRVSGDEDLTIQYKGVYIGNDNRHRVTVNNTAFSTFGPIRALRGKKFGYPSVFLYLVSACDDYVFAGVYYNLKWQPKCAVTEIDARADATSGASLFQSDRAFFVVNARTAAAATIRVRNPAPMEAPWTLIDNPFTLRAQIRAKGEQSQWADVPGGQWPRIEFCKNEAKSGAPPSCYLQCRDAAAPKCCQGFGQVCDDARPCCGGVAISCRAGVCQYDAATDNATVTFDATALMREEGAYELRVAAFCSGDLETASAVVPGRIDRTPPRTFGTGAEPADRLWWPGDEISMSFTEEVQCDRPFRFGSSVLVDGMRINISSPVDTVCEATKLRFAFSRTLIQMPDLLIGKTVTMSVTQVPDLALNTLAEATWAFTVGRFELGKASVKLTDVRVPFDATAANETDLNAAVARLLVGANGPLSQLTVTPLAAAPTRKRALSRSFSVDVAAGGDAGVGAMSIASGILQHKTVDTSATQVAISAPNNPGGVGAAFEPGAPLTSVLQFFETALGIAVIVIVIIILVGIIVLIVVCVVFSQRRRAAAAATAAAPSASSGTEMRNDFLAKSPSRRSRRSVRSAAPQPYVDYGATQPTTFAPSTYAPPATTVNYSTLPKPLAKSESSRRRSMRRRESSRRRKQQQPVVYSAPPTYQFPPQQQQPPRVPPQAPPRQQPPPQPY